VLDVRGGYPGFQNFNIRDPPYPVWVV
jgi:hypothetical protein